MAPSQREIIGDFLFSKVLFVAGLKSGSAPAQCEKRLSLQISHQLVCWEINCSYVFLVMILETLSKSTHCSGKEEQETQNASGFEEHTFLRRL